MQYELGFIGAGNMAEAIARAAIGRGVLEPGAMVAADPAPARRELLNSLGIRTVEAGQEVVADARHVMLAVKPQGFADVAPLLEALDRRQQVVISIMAGVRCETIERATGGPARVVRVMPNTPVMAGGGMAAVALGANAQNGDETLAMRLFEAAGRAVLVDESDMDAVTAVSGSGPAYVFYLAEAMEAAAEQLGLATHARLLVSQTLLGAAMLLSQSEHGPAELRRRVTSPGGTTEAAIGRLDARGMREAVIEAIVAARDRGIELGS